jgi:hypothetical protein
MARTNQQGREIWFDRWLWSYMPCHWKGWASVVAVVAAGLVGAFSIDAMTNARNQPSPWSALFMFSAVVFGWWIAERHSPPKRRDF